MADYVIDGARIAGIPDLYAQLNSLFMASEDWRLGASLDALDDLLYGGFGALSGDEAVRVVWWDAAHSRDALGQAETERWLRAKLAQPGTFDSATIRRQLDEVLAGTGPTYFDLVLEVFAGHPDVRLELR
ncbi:ribonuclease inhibitor [Microbacterium sp. EYE_5]|uniref:ribonuclease inhibitor n=1 Tax=unclassified Microbacterium TaxID=2609290 RepID=UPI0020053190|nr:MULTISPECIES: ribonuclease inhibitor [unclassified Microbacterium]MCK6079517.1 ribonuclease inhibitor [Microbacterium sp. EYE_382]MCK6084787.1 ribonuclease inhibitor [Microbacterium sp. EYE_384]MCK6122986.1 ribonuclease inhibitor [Microbacterium sp. EYE_80]MCK6125551.1 ribonuclease inhibitor [Microbacterium sp. EYE_79]MCK6140471.1 ribonuclease inhibitor [Microbacterium sp. EYE_39]